MAQFPFQTGATSKTIGVRAYIDTTFLDKTGLAYNTAGLTAYYCAGATGTATAITLATQTVGGAWSSGGFVERDAINMPGLYRLDLPNAVLSAAAGTLVFLKLKGTNVVFEPIDILLTADDPTAAAATVAAIADQVWDEALSGHTTAGSAGKSLADTETSAGTASSEATTGASTGLSIKAKTDDLTFTVAGVVDANVQRINDVAVTGDGSVTPFGV